VALLALFLQYSNAPLAGCFVCFEVIFCKYRQRYCIAVWLFFGGCNVVSHYLIGPLDIFKSTSDLSLWFSPTDYIFAFCPSGSNCFCCLRCFMRIRPKKRLWRFKWFVCFGCDYAVAIATALWRGLNWPEALGVAYSFRLQHFVNLAIKSNIPLFLFDSG